jgi:hypothetical protein
MNIVNSSLRLRFSIVGLFSVICLSACSGTEAEESVDPGSNVSFSYNCETVQTSYNLGLADPNGPAIEYCESIGEFQR